MSRSQASMGSEATSTGASQSGFRAPNRSLIRISFIADQPRLSGTNAKGGSVLFDTAYLSEVSRIMLIRTLTLHSLTYVVGITSSMAVQQVIPSPGRAERSQSATGSTAITTQQIVNRSIKSDRLPIRRSKPEVNDKAPVQVPAQITLTPKYKANCKPPIDVPGRCFADAGANHQVA